MISTLLTIYCIGVLGVWRYFQFLRQGLGHAGCEYVGEDPTGWFSYRPVTYTERYSDYGICGFEVNLGSWRCGRPWPSLLEMFRRRIGPAIVIAAVPILARTLTRYRLVPFDAIEVLLAIAFVNAVLLPWTIAYSGPARILSNAPMASKQDNTNDEHFAHHIKVSMEGWRRERSLRRGGVTEKGKTPGDLEFYPRLLRIVWRIENVSFDVCLVVPAFILGVFMVSDA